MSFSFDEVRNRADQIASNPSLPLPEDPLTLAAVELLVANAKAQELSREQAIQITTEIIQASPKANTVMDEIFRHVESTVPNEYKSMMLSAILSVLHDKNIKGDELWTRFKEHNENIEAMIMQIMQS
ncbi:hypothetical protein ACQ4M3_35285 [Leptolyngbya sp. AN03gr2]|uniref:hypothetical protein n=1 Tax=unclassified Leptolyngbya TaxID=2650499 RepID=UPI003D319354